MGSPDVNLTTPIVLPGSRLEHAFRKPSPVGSSSHPRTLASSMRPILAPLTPLDAHTRPTLQAVVQTPSYAGSSRASTPTLPGHGCSSTPTPTSTSRLGRPIPFPGSHYPGPPPNRPLPASRPLSISGQYIEPLRIRHPAQRSDPGEDPFSQSYVRDSSSIRQRGEIPVTPTNSSFNLRPLSSSPPRTAQEIYLESQKKKIPAADRILAAVQDFRSENREFKAQSDDKFERLEHRLTTMSKDFDALKEKHQIIMDDNTVLRENDLQMSKRMEYLQSSIDALPEKGVFANVDSDLDILKRSLTAMTGKIESLSVALADRHKVSSDCCVSKTSTNTDALSNLLNHVTNKLNSIDELSLMLKSLNGLPDAIRDVVVFKDALDTLTNKAEGYSPQRTSQPLGLLGHKGLPPSPTSPCQQGDLEIRKSTSLQSSFKQYITRPENNIAQLPDVSRTLEAQPTVQTSGAASAMVVQAKHPGDQQILQSVTKIAVQNDDSGVDPPAEDQGDKLDDLANAAASQERLAEFSAPITESPNTSIDIAFSSLNQFVDAAITSMNFTTLNSAAESYSPLQRDPGRRGNSSQPRESLLFSPTFYTPPLPHDPPSPSASFSINQPIPSPVISSPITPSHSQNLDESHLSPESRSSKKARISPPVDPSDRPVTRLMSNTRRELTKWSPNSQIEHRTAAQSPSILRSSPSTTLKGASTENAIEISSGSSQSQPLKPLKKTSVGQTNKSKNPVGRPRTRTGRAQSNVRDIENSVLFSKAVALKGESLNSGVESIPMREQLVKPASFTSSIGNKTIRMENMGDAGKRAANKAAAAKMEREQQQRRMTSVIALGPGASGGKSGGKGKRRWDQDST
ncbi:uncharacterized protein I206_106697 [Kwoniella pini CBS 10737]|uniref:Uncharacterized protein n=1 Tax=Kwoniella pini CBS 10737 TaxID=1296096 RepID=A0A1B9HTG6_9TREE|nr:uncharacterized protein I206_07414 [Kwoniella pini CBS 10737]OCF46561.1 hypothetical protein I206_07414 [Kwoniella pini CBS 10737]